MFPRKNLLANTQEISIITSMDDLYQLKLTSPPPSLSSSTNTLTLTAAHSPAETPSATTTPPPELINPYDFAIVLNGEDNNSNTDSIDTTNNNNDEESFSPKHQGLIENNNDNSEDNNAVYCDGNRGVDFDNLTEEHTTTDNINNSCEDFGGEVDDFNSSAENLYFGGDDELLMLETANITDNTDNNDMNDISNILSNDEKQTANITPQQAIIQHVLRHQLLPHFQRVMVYLKKASFLTDIGEEDVYTQQQYLQAHLKGQSVERFLMSYDVICPLEEPPEGCGDDDVLRKIYQLKKAYDEELVNMDNACNAFVARMRYLQLEHNKIVPISEQQIQAKTILIQNKFGYLRKQLKSNICSAMLTVLVPKLKIRQSPISTMTNTITHTTTTDNLSNYYNYKYNNNHNAFYTVNSSCSNSNINSTNFNINSNISNDNANSSNNNQYIKTEKTEDDLPYSKESEPEDEDNDEDYDNDEDARNRGDKKHKFAGNNNISRSKTKMRDLRKKKKKALSKSATEVLSNWFNEHLKDPYPSEAEKKSLASSLGLHINQVNNWFGNKRIRHKRRIQEMAELQQRQLHFKR